MKTLFLILYIVAAVLFAIAVFVPSTVTARFNLVAAGLLAWVLVPLISTADALTD